MPPEDKPTGAEPADKPLSYEDDLANDVRSAYEDAEQRGGEPKPDAKSSREADAPAGASADKTSRSEVRRDEKGRFTRAADDDGGAEAVPEGGKAPAAAQVDPASANAE